MKQASGPLRARPPNSLVHSLAAEPKGTWWVSKPGIQVEMEKGRVQDRDVKW